MEATADVASATPPAATAEPRRRWHLRQADRIVIAVTVALTVIPVAADWVIGGTARLFSYTAADSFYYLVVSRNWARHGVPSFDGRHATNGFQPLWQAAEALLSRITQTLHLGPQSTLWVVLVFQLTLMAGTVVLLAWVLVAVHGRLTRWFVLLPFGWYAVLFTPVWLWSGALEARGINPVEGPLPLYGTLWSYVNGMETPFALAAYAVVLWRLVRSPVRGRRAGIWLGCALALLLLSRLDLVFVVGAVLVTWLVLAWIHRDREIARAAIVATAIPAATLAAYLIGNKAYAGTAFPVSGAAKTTFPRPTLGNWRDFSSLLNGNHALAPVRLYRHGPVLLCAFVAIIFLATTGRAAWARARFAADDPAVRYHLALAATATGVVLLSAYDWFFVPAYAQGHWYWPVSTVFVSLACFEWLGAAARTWERRSARTVAHRAPGAAPTAVAAGVLGALCLTGFLVLGHRDGYHARFAAFALHAAPGARSFLQTADPHGAQLFAVDDGIDAWELDLPALSGTGLMLDHAAEQARKQGRLVDVAVARGADHVSSVAYVDTRGIDAASSSDKLAARLQLWLPGQDLRDFHFSVEYRSRPLPNPLGGSSPFVLMHVSRRS